MLLFTSVITSLSVPVKYTYTGQRCMCDFRGVLYTPLCCPGSPKDIKLHFFMQSLPVLTLHYNSQYIVCFQNSFLYKISCPTFQSGCPVAHSHTVPRSTVQPYGSPRSHGSTVNRPTVRFPTVTRFHGQPSNRPTVRSPTVTRFHGHTVNRETVADRDLTV